LNDDVVGEQAKELFDDAQELLKEIIEKQMLAAKAVIGFFPCNSSGDDIMVYQNDDPKKQLTTLHHLRQQIKKGTNQPNRCLNDFIAPKESGTTDYIGAFAVTAGIGIEKWIEEFKSQHDDYKAILLQALADRLAEAFAERMHQKVRMELWGYAKDETLKSEELISEKYQGIRPAPGYPACPDHTEKQTLFKILDAEKNTSIKLTESCAMHPAASVSGWYFAHPEAKYFGIGKIGKDQVEDLAKRKNISFEEMERWLRSVVNY
jgi:5-methyltetrahydrofolate--homocysteine methyltransferase